MTTHFSWQAGVIASELESTTKLTLLVIGSYMNQHGNGAFPSYNTIAKDASLNRTTVIRHVDLAVDAGWLTKQTRVRPAQEGGKIESDSNLYSVAYPVVAQNNHPLVAQGNQVVAQDNHPSGTEPLPVVAQNHPNTPVLTPHLTPHNSMAADAADIDFQVTRKAAPGEDAFSLAWVHYPKRAGGNSKAAAKKAWDARVKGGEDPQAMLAGTQRYANFCKATGKLDTEYVKQAATFFGPALHYAEAWTAPRPANDNRPHYRHTGLDSFDDDGQGNVTTGGL